MLVLILLLELKHSETSYYMIFKIDICKFLRILTFNRLCPSQKKNIYIYKSSIRVWNDRMP